MDKSLQCFTAYDVRGRVPDELDVEIARRIGMAFGDQFQLTKAMPGFLRQLNLHWVLPL